MNGKFDQYFSSHSKVKLGVIGRHPSGSQNMDMQQVKTHMDNAADFDCYKFRNKLIKHENEKKYLGVKKQP